MLSLAFDAAKFVLQGVNSIHTKAVSAKMRDKLASEQQNILLAAAMVEVDTNLALLETLRLDSDHVTARRVAVAVAERLQTSALTALVVRAQSLDKETIEALGSATEPPEQSRDAATLGRREALREARYVVSRVAALQFAVGAQQETLRNIRFSTRLTNLRQAQLNLLLALSKVIDSNSSRSGCW